MKSTHTGRIVTVGNYGKGFSLVLRRKEVPSHTMAERLEAVVARPSSPEFLFKLYANDNLKTRDVHFVATQLDRIIHELLSKPGLSTKAIGIQLGIGYSYALKYLNELKEDGKVYSSSGGIPSRPRLDWYIKT